MLVFLLLWSPVQKIDCPPIPALNCRMLTHSLLKVTFGTSHDLYTVEEKSDHDQDDLLQPIIEKLMQR